MSSKQLTGPKSQWLKWREARDRKIANPRRNKAVARLAAGNAKKRAAKEPT